MATPRSPREENRSPLPVPYEDPRRRLAADLEAVLAAAGLKVRELWRLSGEGALPTPALWPRELAAWFWPLLLALGLALMVGLGLQLPGLWSAGHAEPAGRGTGGVELSDAGPAEGWSAERPAASSGRDSGKADPARAGSDGVSLPPATALPAPATTDPDREPSAPAGPGDQGSGSTAQPIPGGMGPEAASAGADAAAQPSAGNPARVPADDTSALTGTNRAAAAGEDVGSSGSAAISRRSSEPDLLTDLIGSDSPAWVLALEQRPADGLLRLRLDGGFEALSLKERRTLAERWLKRCRELGFDHLELVASTGRLLARPARVGSGMILLDPDPSPP